MPRRHHPSTRNRRPPRTPPRVYRNTLVEDAGSPLVPAALRPPPPGVPAHIFLDPQRCRCAMHRTITRWKPAGAADPGARLSLPPTATFDDPGHGSSSQRTQGRSGRVDVGSVHDLTGSGHPRWNRCDLLDHCTKAAAAAWMMRRRQGTPYCRRPSGSLHLRSGEGMGGRTGWWWPRSARPGRSRRSDVGGGGMK